MKAILISIRPEWVAKILNGNKTIEIRKKFPNGYVGWVYIYCCKQRKNEIGCHINYEKVNGKVVARFWCDKVEEILSKENGNFYTNFLSNRKLLTQSCLAQNELRDYMAGNWKQKFYSYWYGGYAIHITKVEPFDRPKEIKEFQGTCNKSCEANRLNVCKIKPNCNRPLTRAPQSWCYVEI